MVPPYPSKIIARGRHKVYYFYNNTIQYILYSLCYIMSNFQNVVVYYFSYLILVIRFLQFESRRISAEFAPLRDNIVSCEIKQNIENFVDRVERNRYDDTEFINERFRCSAHQLILKPVRRSASVRANVDPDNQSFITKQVLRVSSIT